MQVADTIQQARAAAPQLPDDRVLASLAFHPQEAEEEEIDEADTIDTNETFREMVCCALNSDLQSHDHTFIRYLFAQEVQAHRYDTSGVGENLRRCAYLLYRLGHVEDSVLLWEAKDISFDTFCGVEVQLLIGAGLSETLNYIETQPNTAEMREHIEACYDAGDFADMEGYTQAMEQYFGFDQEQ